MKISIMSSSYSKITFSPATFLSHFISKFSILLAGLSHELYFCLACELHVGATVLLGLQHFIWKSVRLELLLQFYFKMG